MMENYLTHEEIILMRKAGKIAAKILHRIGSKIRPGITTKQIEDEFDNNLSNYSE